MDKIYQKYVILLKIKKLKAYKLKLESKWTFWFHKLYEDYWSINSYKKLYTFDNISEFWCLYNNLKYLHNGMFFLMKNDIKPIYEDKHNINGVEVDFRANSQLSFTSTPSAGLKTKVFGVALNIDKCSIGWCVGPSSPRPIES